MKRQWYIWVGIAILLVAVLIVLGVIFLPRLAAKSDMKDFLTLAAAPDAQYVMLIDPSYRHEGILAGEGRELALTGGRLQQTQNALSAFAESFSYVKKEVAGAGAFGLHLLVKSAEGKFVKICFFENGFYAELKGSMYYFAANDEQAYMAFYNTLISAFE